jgi:hypothetical protein
MIVSLNINENDPSRVAVYLEAERPREADALREFVRRMNEAAQASPVGGVVLRVEPNMEVA